MDLTNEELKATKKKGKETITLNKDDKTIELLKTDIIELYEQILDESEKEDNTGDEMFEEEKVEHFKSCWESTVKELQDLAEYTNYLEEKIMYALGPKNKEFSNMTKCNFAKILRKAFYKKADTYEIKQNFKDFYNNM